MILSPEQMQERAARNRACASALWEWLRHWQFNIPQRKWMALQAAILLFASISQAASLTLTWEPNPEAVDYVVWSGPASGEYDRATIIRQSTVTFTNLVVGRLYRFGVTTLAAGNGSETSVIIAAAHESVMVLEWAATPSGPWMAQATNVFSASPGFYRARMEIR